MVEARACHMVEQGAQGVVKRGGAREHFLVADQQREDEVEEQ